MLTRTGKSVPAWGPYFVARLLLRHAEILSCSVGRYHLDRRYKACLLSCDQRTSQGGYFSRGQEDFTTTLRGAVICVAVGSLIANGDDVHSRACGMHFYRRESGDTVVKGVDPNMLNMAVVPERC